MPRENGMDGASRLMLLASATVVVAALYLARDVLIPLSLAVLLCFLLAPVVKRLERTGIGRVPSVLISVLLALGVLGGLGWIVGDQVVSLTRQLPDYENNIRHKIQALHAEATGGIGAVTRTIEELRGAPGTQPATRSSSALQRSSQEMPAGRTAPPEQSNQTALSNAGRTGDDGTVRPVPVQVIEPSSKILGLVRDTLGVLAPGFAAALICFVVVIFVLVQLEDVRDRLLRLMGEGQINITTQALDEITNRISRYLLVQLIINASYGVAVGIGLYLIGIPNAALFGLLAALLRYLPYIGPWIAASFPLALALAAFEDWRHVLGVAVLFVAIELFIANFMEPWLYGSTTGLSKVAVVVAAVFWGWLWGPIGLLLSTPMTVCLAVMGKHTPQLEFLGVLLSDEPVLGPATRFYQRLLASDQEEATDLLEQHIEQHSLAAAFDELVLPALRLAEQGRHRGRLRRQQQELVYSGVRAVLEDIRETPEPQGSRGHARKPAPPERPATPSGLAADFRVLCIPARDEADEIAALMLATLLGSEGIHAEHVSTEYLAGEIFKQIQKAGARAVCISAIPPGAVTYARYLCKRLRPQLSDMPVLVGLWNATGDLTRISERMKYAGATELVTTMAEAVDQLTVIGQHQALRPAEKSKAS